MGLKFEISGSQASNFWALPSHAQASRPTNLVLSFQKR